MTALNDQGLDLEQVSPILKSLMQGQLKTTYLLIQTLAFEGIKEDVQGQSDRARQLLQQIKDLQPEQFSQSTIFLLKQLQNDPPLKEKVLELFAHQGEEGSSTQLVSTFGDKEYSILSALGSNRQATRLHALKAVEDMEFVKSLSENELLLVEFVILQLLN